MSGLRYLWAYNAPDAHRDAWNQRFARRCRERGYDVEAFCVTPPSLERGWLPFPDLHRRWREGDSEIMDVHQRLARALDDRDVFILFNGSNVHPEFAAATDAISVYHCADDPESSEILSAPVAPAFDISLVANIACVDLYRSWGIDSAHFLPLGSQVFTPDVEDLTPKRVLEIERPVPLFLACERISNRRRERLDALANAFPQASFVGRGWPNAYISWDQLWDTYRQTQIGWNIHNSVGPVNFRTYDLAAFGVMQICDNRDRLAHLYDLGEEAVGFETIDECIDLTRHYLTHQDEQRAIAAAGRKRWERDYTPAAVWDRIVDIVGDHIAGHHGMTSTPRPSLEVILRRRKREAGVWKIFNKVRKAGSRIRSAAVQLRAVMQGFLEKTDRP